MQTPTAFLAEYIDDWKVPYLRTYTHSDFSKKLCSFGFEKTSPLPYGMDYDTSHRVNLFPEDKIFLGEGDLRYLVTKTSTETPCNINLSNSSECVYSSIYKEEIDEKFEIMIKKIDDDLLKKMITCAYIQRNLRDNIFLKTHQFDLNVFLSYFNQANAYLKVIS